MADRVRVTVSFDDARFQGENYTNQEKSELIKTMFEQGVLTIDQFVSNLIVEVVAAVGSVEVAPLAA